MGNLLDRKKLLQREVLEVVKIEFETGDFVYVRQMTGRERDNFEQSLIKENKKAEGGYEKVLGDFRAKLAVNVICDDKGDLLLEPGDYPTLSSSMSASHLEKIVNEAQKLNAISSEDKEKLIKNSDAGQAGNSSSDSVEN